MSEERLRTLLREGLDTIPLPPQFASPSRLVFQAPAPHRRIVTWMLSTAAAVAVLAVALGFTPLGMRVARAVTGWFVADIQVVQGSNSRPVPEDLLWALQGLQPGQSLQVPPVMNPGGVWKTYQGQTLAQLTEGNTIWPLPTRLPPAPETAVIVTQMYMGERLVSTSLQMNYKVRLGRAEHWVFYHFSPALTPRTEKPDAFESYLITPNLDNVKQKTVTLKGQEATAISTDGGKVWTIHWFSAAGDGQMSSDLPLVELVRIVNSIPQL